ncbi:MAG: ROK family protein [Prevotellaceae bacterium]|jgi:glucokinase|nr:ROK family protein [Prevotellaceae bacterium]
MKSYQFDKRIVLTLDAGGTNFVFSTIQANIEIVEPIYLDAHANNLEKSLNALVEGFTQVLSILKEKPVAISFAFPGPADYPNGIISDDLPNFPAFKGEGGVAIGPFLHEKFGLPVFINNDGDLFAYGEALAGVLPEVNKKLENANSIKRYRNLLGLTLGTGFGAGIVIKNQLLTGDNSCGAEIYSNRNPKYPGYIVEESISIRGIKHCYAKLSGDTTEFTPKDIYEIAEGTKPGNQDAAKLTFAEFGDIAGDSIANIISIIDGLIVIGGGLAAASKYLLPAMLKQLNGKILQMNGEQLDRIPQKKVYNLDDENEFAIFAKGSARKIKIPGVGKTMNYDPERRIGIAISKLGASKAIMLGAYAFALHEIDNSF